MYEKREVLDMLEPARGRSKQSKSPKAPASGTQFVMRVLPHLGIVAIMRRDDYHLQLSTYICA